MERRRQTFEEIISSLSRIESAWKDEHAQSVMDLLDASRKNLVRGPIEALLYIGKEAPIL